MLLCLCDCVLSSVVSLFVGNFTSYAILSFGCSREWNIIRICCYCFNNVSIFCFSCCSIVCVLWSRQSPSRASHNRHHHHHQQHHHRQCMWVCASVCTFIRFAHVLFYLYYLLMGWNESEHIIKYNNMLARFGCPCARRIQITHLIATSFTIPMLLHWVANEGGWHIFLPSFSFILSVLLVSFLFPFYLVHFRFAKTKQTEKYVDFVELYVCVRESECLVRHSVFTSTLPSVLFVFVIRMSFTLAWKCRRRLLTWHNPACIAR